MNEPSPYTAPETRADARPAVIFWYRGYAGMMTILYLVVLALAVSMGTAAPKNSPAELAAITLGFAAFALAVFYGLAIFVPLEPWGWTIGVVAIGLGLASCAVVAAVPLIIHWTRPNVRAAFRRL